MKALSRTKSVLTAVVVVLPCLVAGAARADVSIVDNDKTVHVDCGKDPNVALIGNHNTITATGVCDTLTISGNDCSFVGSVSSATVSGNHNTVTLAAADQVSVPGSDNTITVKKAIKRKSPSISNTGTHNNVSH